MTKKTNSRKNNDNMLKVIALICAVLLWFYAETQENPSIDRQLAVPIQYVNVAAGYVVEDGAQSVQVVVKGKEADVVSLRSDDFKATVDLANAPVGSGTYAVYVTSETVSDRFSYTPNQVTVSVDQILQKEVPVRVRTDGTVAQAFELKNTDVQPDVVTIRGKSGQLADITDVETQVISLSGINDDLMQQVALRLPDGVTAQVDDMGFTSEAEVTVEFHVQQKQKTVTLTPTVALRNVPESYRAALEPETVTLTLQGSMEYMNAQPFMDLLSLHVDCSNLEAGVYTLPVQVEAASEEARDVVQSVEPQTITVTLVSEEQTESDAPSIEVNGAQTENEIGNETSEISETTTNTAE